MGEAYALIVAPVMNPSFNNDFIYGFKKNIYMCMKKRFLYLLFVAFAAMSVSIITFTSCSSNKDEEELPAKENVQKLLIGRWNFVANYDSEGNEVDQRFPGESIWFDLQGNMEKHWFNVTLKRDRWTIVEDGGKLYLLVNAVQQYRIKKLNEDEFEYYYDEPAGKYSKFKKSK